MADRRYRRKYFSLIAAALIMFTSCNIENMESVSEDMVLTPTESQADTDQISSTAYWNSLSEDVLEEAGDNSLIVTSPGAWNVRNLIPEAFEKGAVIEGYYSSNLSAFVVIPKHENTTIEIFIYDHSNITYKAYDDGIVPPGSHPIHRRTEHTEYGVEEPFFILLPFQYNSYAGFGVRASWEDGDAVFYFGCHEEYNQGAGQIQSLTLIFPLEIPKYTQYASWVASSDGNEGILASVVNTGKYVDRKDGVVTYGSTEHIDSSTFYRYLITPRYMESTLRLYQEIGSERILLEEWFNKSSNVVVIPLPSKENGSFLLTVDYEGEHGEFSFELDENQAASGRALNVSYRLFNPNLGYYMKSIAEIETESEKKIIAYNTCYRLAAYLPEHQQFLLGAWYGLGGESLFMDPAVYKIEDAMITEYPNAELDGYRLGTMINRDQILIGIDDHYVPISDRYKYEYAVRIFDLSTGLRQYIPLLRETGTAISSEDADFGQYPYIHGALYDMDRNEFLWFYARSTEESAPLAELYCARINWDGKVLSNRGTGILFDSIEINWGTGQRPTSFLMDNGIVYFSSVQIEYNPDTENAKIGPTTLVAYDPLTNQYQRTVVYEGQEQYQKNDDYNERGKNIRLITETTIYFLANRTTCYAIQKQSGEVLSEFTISNEEVAIQDIYAVPESEDILIAYTDGRIFWHNAVSLQRGNLLAQLKENERLAGLDRAGNLVVMFKESAT